MSTLSLHLFFLYLLISTTSTTPSPYDATDYILLNCGSPSNEHSPDGRNWDGDTGSKFAYSNISSSSEKDSSYTQVPYMTARIFHSPFIYTFPVSTGPKFIRLYFYPATYSGLDITTSFFSVTANDYILLTNFSAFLTVSAIKPKVFVFIKEFIVTVKENQRLNITFSPSPNSFAFVNGIEVVSIPENFYIQGSDYPIPLVGQENQGFVIDNNFALEKVYRLNVGGSYVSVTSDTGMYREWSSDQDFIYGNKGLPPSRDVPILYTKVPPYTAPKEVYTTSRTMGRGKESLTYNLTWIFPIDSGFYYLLRLHFCEIQKEVTQINQRVFKIFINNHTAQREADVIRWSGGTGIPVFRDYVVWDISPNGQRSKQELWLAMHPDLGTKSMYGDAILNGLEIFKLNGSDLSLAGPNPEVESIPPPTPMPTSPENNQRTSPLPLGIIIGGVLGSLVVLLILIFLIFRGRRIQDSGSTHAKSSWVPISDTSKSAKTTGSSLPSDLCRRFSLEEIKSATFNFDDNFIIGTGGFGNVYKGQIEEGSITVAIKRLNQSSNQGAHEFQTEIGMLSKLRHVHLVSLIGYCNDNNEMILVYDYMAHGTLRDHLYKPSNQPVPHLPWKRRLQICIGAARGLHYLHTGAKRAIIHRDVKSTNILLDEKWVAKVSDFGLSKLGPKDVGHTHVSTVVKGSFGYVDPEYYRLQQLTEKSDVYSFGVVLFEVLCGRPAIIPNLPNKEQVNLAQWAQFCYKKGTLNRIIDPNLRDEIAPECLRKFGEVGNSCLHDEGIKRPGMNDVVWGLEFALQLQETAEKMGLGQGGGLMASPQTGLLFLNGEATTTDDDAFSGSGENVSQSKSSGISTGSSDRMKSEIVFSEITNPTAR